MPKPENTCPDCGEMNRKEFKILMLIYLGLLAMTIWGLSFISIANAEKFQRQIEVARILSSHGL